MGKVLRAVLGAVLCWAAAVLAAPGQELSALARLLPAQSAITDTPQGARITLALSQPVPWRVRLLADPPRLLVDVREVDWSGIAAVPRAGAVVTGLRAGVFRPGWSRLVVDLAGPMTVAGAGLETKGETRLTVTLALATPERFALEAARPEPPGWAPPPARGPVAPPRVAGGPVVVVLDPGHGGIDPGAERGGLTEAGLMLTFARELKAELVRAGGFAVVLTREQDVFVPLEARISVAHAARADVFLSLHADALAEGEAVGATIYTLSEAASDAASAALAERHDRDDLLSGVDLSAQDDLVAGVLMDIARTQTAPRTQRLAGALQGAITGAGLKMHRRPHQMAAFSVLKAADIPSALLEIGFLSSGQDLARLTDGAWRARMAAAVAAGLAAWAREDAALSALAPR